MPRRMRRPVRERKRWGGRRAPSGVVIAAQEVSGMKALIKVIAVIALFAAFLVLPACNTTKGFGTDMEKAGEGLQNSATKNGAQ